MATSWASVRALRLVHTLHDMTEHLPLNPERLLPESPSHQAGLALNTPLLHPSPLLGQPPLIPPNLHQHPRQ